jgi:hypothetical protein
MRLLFVLAVLACAVGCLRVQGSGSPASQVRDMGPFHEVVFGDGFAGTLTTGADGPVVLSGDDNVLPLFETEVKAGRLTVKLEDPTALVDPRTELRVAIEVARIDLVELTGGASLRGSGSTPSLRVVCRDGASATLTELTTKSAEVDLTGGADVALHVDGPLSGTVSGGSKLTVEGTVTLWDFDAAPDSTVEVQ